MPLVAQNKRAPYTTDEVSTHNTAASLWVIMNRKVYDVTAFHKRHPGGPIVMLQMGGKDATVAAAAAHKSALPGNLMWEFCIGHVVRTKPAPKVGLVPPPNAAAAQGLEPSGAAASVSAASSSSHPVAAAATAGAGTATAPSPKAAATDRNVPKFKLERASTTSSIIANRADHDEDIDGDIRSSRHAELGSDTGGGESTQANRDEALTAAVEMLTRMLRGDDRLAAVWGTADSERARLQVRRLLAPSFAGHVPSSLRVTSSLMEGDLNDLVEAVLAACPPPPNSGEDTVAVGLRGLVEGELPDPRVLMYQARLRRTVSSNLRVGEAPLGGPMSPVSGAATDGGMSPDCSPMSPVPVVSKRSKVLIQASIASSPDLVTFEEPPAPEPEPPWCDRGVFGSLCAWQACSERAAPVTEDAAAAH